MGRRSETDGHYRVTRGGSFTGDAANFAFFIEALRPAVGYEQLFWFRLETAVVVPEPSTAALAIMAGGLMWVLRKRFK